MIHLWYCNIFLLFDPVSLLPEICVSELCLTCLEVLACRKQQMFVKGLLQRFDDSHWYTGGVAIGGFAEFVFLPILISPTLLHKLLGTTMFDLWNWIDLLILQTCGILMNSAYQADRSGTPSGPPGRNSWVPSEAVGNSWFRIIFPTPFPCQHPRNSTALSKVAPSNMFFLECPLVN